MEIEIEWNGISEDRGKDGVYVEIDVFRSKWIGVAI